MAGIYDALLGGTGNQAADPDAVRQFDEAVPGSAQAVCPGAAVAYIDNDPPVVEDTQWRLAGATWWVAAVEGDVRYPDDMLGMREIRDVIDFSRSVTVLLVAVLHFAPDRDRSWSAVRWITDYPEWWPGCRAEVIGGPALFWAGIGCKPGSGQ